jgi:hypothetical protein
VERKARRKKVQRERERDAERGSTVRRRKGVKEVGHAVIHQALHTFFVDTLQD